MEKMRFVLVDPDPVYVERFMEYVHRKPNFLFAVAGYTGLPELMASQEEIRLALVDEDCYRQAAPALREELKSRCLCVILLSDRKHGAEAQPHVWRYQSMETLLPEIIRFYEEALPKVTEPEERTQFDIFYSPQGRCGTTTCALLLGHRLAEQCGRTVLYMNLEALAEDPTRSGAHSLSDLLYYRQNGGQGQRLQSLTGAVGSLSVLGPVMNPEDLWTLPGETLVQILTEVREAGLYDTVILDLGAREEPLPILDLGRRVFLIHEENGPDGKWETFLSYARGAHDGELPASWHVVEPPRMGQLVGAPAGTRCEELETWLEKEWSAWT